MKRRKRKLGGKYYYLLLITATINILLFIYYYLLLIKSRRIQSAKHKHRPKLCDWERDKFAYDNTRKGVAFQTYKDISSTISSCGYRDIDNPRDRNSIDIILENEKIDRIHCSNMKTSEFVHYFEEPSIPCIISGIPEKEQWDAIDNWTFQNLRTYGDRYFKVGEDDDGYKVKVRMKYFLKYLERNNDDSPLYVFDSNYDNDAVSKKLLNDYSIPSYFSDDLFELVGEKRRPPYRWFLAGPERSGTCVHIDPLGTSAWNTVIEGRKRWVIFKPHTPKDIVKGKNVLLKGEDDEAINYFVDIVPRIRREYSDVKVIEFTQMPGDTVFIPGGWWHAVLNLDNTIAITQNFCSRTNFERVWIKTRSGRKKMAVKWLKLLDEKYPQLANIARELNREDDFIMHESKSYEKNRSKKSDKNKDNDEISSLDDTTLEHSRDSRVSRDTDSSKKRSGSDNSIDVTTPKYQRR